MSYFYTCIQGSRDSTTRTGDKSSCTTASAFSWGIDGTVATGYSEELSIGIAHLYITRNNDRTKSLVISLVVVDSTLKCTQSNYPELFV